MIGEAQAKFGISTLGLMKMFAQSKITFQRVGLNFTDMLNTIVGLQGNFQMFDRTGEAAGKMLANIVPILRSFKFTGFGGEEVTGLPPQETAKIMDQLTKFIGGMDLAALQKALAFEGKGIQSKEELAEARLDPVRVLRGIFKPLEQSFVGTQGELDQFRQSLAQARGLGEVFGGQIGPDILNAILAGTRPTDEASTALVDEYEKFIKDQKKVEAEKAKMREEGFAAMAASKTIWQKIENFMRNFWREFTNNIANPLSQLVTAINSINPLKWFDTKTPEEQKTTMNLQKKMRGLGRDPQIKNYTGQSTKSRRYIKRTKIGGSNAGGEDNSDEWLKHFHYK